MTYAIASAAVEPLDILLMVLVVVAVWAVVELALVFRKARKTVDEIGKSANETIEQVQPIIAKADGIVDDLQPSIKQVGPLMEKAQNTVDVATVDLARVNDILADVSEVSGTAANVTGVVNKVADSAGSGVSRVISKLTGKHEEPAAGKHARIEEGRPEPAPEAPAQEPGSGDAGYVDYSSADDQDAASDAAKE